MGNKRVLDYIEYSKESKARIYVFWGTVDNSYESFVHWLEDTGELFQMLGYPPTHYSLICGKKIFDARRISGLKKKLEMIREENMPIVSLSLEIYPPEHRDWICDTAVMVTLEDSSETRYVRKSNVSLVVNLDYGLPLEEEKILHILRKHIEADTGAIREMPIISCPVLNAADENSQSYKEVTFRKFVRKDGREYWRDFMVEDEELQRLKREGPYEEFQRYCEKLRKRYEAEPEKAEAIENGIFSPETLEVVLKSAEDRDPEDALKMIRHVTERGIEADYRERVSKYNFLGMLYCRACEHWNPEQIMEITKLFVESGVDASQPEWCPDPVVAVIDYLLTCSDCMPFELEPVVAYLAEHGGKIGGKKWSGVSPIDDTLEGEKQREAMILRERYGKKEGGEQNDL